MLASTLACLAAVTVAFRMAREQAGPPAQRLGHAGAMLAETRPDLLDASEGRSKLATMADALGVDVVIGGAQGPLLASPSARPFRPLAQPTPGWRRSPGGPELVVALEPGRWAALRPRALHRRLPIHPFFATLGALAIVMAAASYPVA